MNGSRDPNVAAKNQQVVVLSNCQGGIGIKIVGGRTNSGPSYGIFVKKVIPGSAAERDGCLREGDKIVKVNKEDVRWVSNERAMGLLLNASKAGVVSFLVERSDDSNREYMDLMNTLNNGVFNRDYGSLAHTDSLQHSPRPSPTTVEKRSWVLAGGRMSPMSPGRSSPRNFGTSTGVKLAVSSEKETDPVRAKCSYGDITTNGERPPSLAESNGDSGLHSLSSTLNNMSQVKVVHIPMANGLGMSITGGLNHPDGPNIVVKELISGGDVHCHGQIKQGDQIVGINGETFLNVTHEEAKMKLTQIKLRTEKEFDITFISQGQFGLESTGRDFGKENDHLQINQFPTLSRLANVKDPSVHGNAESVKRGLASPSSKQKVVDENGNYTPSEFHPKLFSTNEHFSSIMQAQVQPSSIPFYLQQDLAVSPELSTINNSMSTSQNDKNGNKLGRVKKPTKRQLSLAATSKLRVEKLEVALSYLGIKLTPKQQDEIRGRLHVDATGLVSYGEFVNVVQEVLQVELQDHSQALTRSKLQFALHDIEKSGLVLPSSLPNTSDTAVEKLKRQLDDALAEARDLRKLLDEKESSWLDEARKLERMKRAAEEALEESMALKDQVHLATEAKIAADRKDEEYEEVIRLLEDELHLVKARGTPKQQEFHDLQKKVVVLGCQLRKVEVVKRTYEVATEKLLGFAERVHDYLKRGVLSPSTVPSSNVPQKEQDLAGHGPPSDQQAPLYLSQRHASQKLADEARDLVRGVRVLLEEEPLPFGWEEAYTTEGERYFINHVTQITSWLHPVTHTKKEMSEDV